MSARDTLQAHLERVVVGRIERVRRERPRQVVERVQRGLAFLHAFSLLQGSAKAKRLAMLKALASDDLAENYLELQRVREAAERVQEIIILEISSRESQTPPPQETAGHVK